MTPGGAARAADQKGRQDDRGDGGPIDAPEPDRPSPPQLDLDPYPSSQSTPPRIPLSGGALEM